MTDSQTSMILAVDGGGTRCRLALLDAEVLHIAEAGSANVSTDFDAACDALRAGLDVLAHKAGLGRDALHDFPAFVGLAGVTGPDMAARVGKALGFKNARIADDRPAALRGALGDRDGVIAHCGTGSFFASRINGKVRFAGGWGAVLGDQASAQWVGRQALALCLEKVDGLRPASPLTDALLTRFDGSAGVVRFASDASPVSFGDLAPVVTEHAAEGDAMARAVMVAAAAEVSRGLLGVRWVPGLPICLTGGIAGHYAADLPEEMRACIEAPQGRPLDGALALAGEVADERR